MKGVVFTEFLEMVEEEFGLEVVDSIITDSDLKSGGSYTAVGTYDHEEMVSLVINLSRRINVEVNDLLKVFGKYLMNRFVTMYPSFFERVDNGFDFLNTVHSYIHVEVKKLYPDAELPEFETLSMTDSRMELKYSSSRKMSGLALGLIEGCMDHFGQKVNIKLEDITEDGSQVLFEIEAE